MRSIVFLLCFACLAICAGGETSAGDPTPGTVDEQREANRKAYDEHAEALRRDQLGFWVVIADGRVLATGKRVEDVQEHAPAALHRFVFRVGDEGDGEVFVSQWYGPRFAGPGLCGALGYDFAPGRGWMRGAEIMPTPGVPPFPRTPLGVGAPGDDLEPLDVFVGTAGPPLALTPADHERMGLARFEVPGTTSVGGVPCRRATVRVEVPGLEGSATLTAVVPHVPPERLVDLGRGRDFGFFQGSEGGFGIWAMRPEPYVEGWVLFGVDRVLGRGETAAEALRAGEGKAPEAYHRFLCRLPRGGEVRYDEDAFTTVETRVLNGERVKVRRSERYGDDVLLATAADLVRLGLHLTESPRCTFVMRGETRRHARCGAAWVGTRRPGEIVATDAEPLGLVWVVCPLPEGTTVWYCEPPPPLPDLPGPK